MARVVVHKENKPVEIKVGDKSVWVCRCGLTTNPPYCSGKHKEIRDEDDKKLYVYEQGKKYEVELIKKEVK